MNPNESQQFLDEFRKPENEDPFAFLTPEATPAEPEKKEETPTDPEPRNRRERRLMEKLQSEKEAAIALAAKLEVITQAQQTRTEASAWEEAVEKIYGNTTPDLREATELLKTALKGAKEEAKREALSEFQSLRQKEQEAVLNAEKRIDQMLEELEDDANADFSNETHRANFLKLMEKMSPKDKNGNIVEYADHFAVWEMYQEKMKSVTPPNPAKDLASRSMATGGGSDTKNSSNAYDRWAVENGLI